MLAFVRHFGIAVSFLASLILAAHTATADEPTKIRIGYPSGLNAQIPIVMDKAGIAGKHQLEATFTGFQNGPPMMEGLVAGQLDAVITSPLPPIVLASKLPGSIAIVAALGNSSHSILVPKDSPAKELNDLRGKKIGVSFTTDSHLDLLVTLKQRGLDPKADVELINLLPNELPSALEKVLVDAVLIRQPQVLRLEETLGAKSIHTWPFHFIAIMRRDYLKQSPQAAPLFQSALREAVFYTASNLDEASRWFGEIQRIDPAVVRKVSVENPLYSSKTLEDVSLELAPDFRQFLAERLDAAFEHGLVRTKIQLESMLP
jgi:ABC-type nitrate/sulfonate/bicarbonate transport system substrate-binding protein